MTRSRYRVAGRLAWMVLGVAGCWLSISCGGSSGTPNTVSGDVTTDRFEVPAGETMMVTADLTVNATESISIAGDLIVAEGVNLSLLSQGDLDIDGYVGEADGQGRDGRQINLTGSVTYLFFGRNVRFNGQPGGSRKIAVKGTKAADIFVGTTDGGTVTVQQQVVGGDGLNSGLPRNAGQAGGSVEIGSDRALAAIRPKVGLVPFPPETVILDATAGDAPAGPLLLGGAGGDGFTDTIGARDEGLREMVFTGTDGGVGGNVAIKTTTLRVLPGSKMDFLQGGLGGTGGGVDQFAGVADANAGPATPAPDGIAPGEAGCAVRAMTGNGGQGGRVFTEALSYESDLDPSQPVGLIGISGVPGPNGSVVRIAPGNGADGGAGGDTIVLIGLPGAPRAEATLHVDSGPSTPTVAAAVTIATGGNGGTSLRAGVPGGNAGFISVLDANRQSVKGTLTLISAHSGGVGFNGCSANPQLPGTNGGGFNTAPLVSVAAVIGPDLTVTPDPLSLNGGNGGSGTPPGTGGQPDVDNLGRPFGRAGQDGSACGDGDGGGGGNDGAGNGGGNDGGGNDGGGTGTVPGVNVTLD